MSKGAGVNGQQSVLAWSRTPASRQSKNKCPRAAQTPKPPKSDDPADIPAALGDRPVTTAGVEVREEAVQQDVDAARAVPWRVLTERWRDWMEDYENSALAFESPDNEEVRVPMTNSYMESYSRRYYARLKDWERAAVRRFSDPHTVMLTFTQSTENANGDPRCPGDHLRELLGAWRDSVRKALYDALSGRDWEYAAIVEPHESGYGHLHVAVVLDGPVGEEQFTPVMDRHVNYLSGAASDAHSLDEAVEVRRVDPDSDPSGDTVGNLGSYISEYLGIFGDSARERPISEQMFFAVAWATQTRRIRFSQGSNRWIRYEKRRRETGTRPEDRGGPPLKSGDSGANTTGWILRAIVRQTPTGEDEYPPGGGPAETSQATTGPPDPPPDYR